MWFLTLPPHPPEKDLQMTHDGQETEEFFAASII